MTDEELNFTRELAGGLRNARKGAIAGPGQKRPNLKNLMAGLQQNKGGATLSRPVQQATSKLLQNAWRTLIPTYGLTLLWINAHIGLGKVFGKEYFCKLGEEWLPKGAQKFGGEAKKIMSGVGLLEAGLVGILDVIVLAVIFLIFALLYIFVDTFIHPFKLVWALVSGNWD